MTIALITATLFFLLASVGFTLVFRRLISRDRTPSLSVDWDDIFSPTRYRAMERLLDEGEYEFVASQAGHNPNVEQKLRAERVRIFRGYVRWLGNDFTRISSAVKTLMLASETDRTDLAGLVMKQQFIFVSAFVAVEFRIILYSFGWSRVEVGALLEAFDGMRAQLQPLIAVVQPSQA